MGLIAFETHVHDRYMTINFVTLVVFCLDDEVIEQNINGSDFSFFSLSLSLFLPPSLHVF